MEDKWLVNNFNIFKLPQKEYLPIFTIQCEIVNQVGELKNDIDKNTLIHTHIDVNAKIKLTSGLTINQIFKEYLFPNKNIFQHFSEISVVIIYEYLTLYLYKIYLEGKHSAFYQSEEFEQNYEVLKSIYLNENIDVNEFDFLEYEFNYCNKILEELKKPVYNIKIGDEKRFAIILERSINKRCQFLNKKKKELLNSEIDIQKNTKEDNTNITFDISQTELIELIKALIENGNIKGKQKEIVENFASFFNISVKYPSKLITDIKNRNIGSETLFIDKLKTSLLNYIQKENTR